MCVYTHIYISIWRLCARLRSYSPELSQLVARCLARDPYKRPSVNELLALPVVKRRIERFLTEQQAAAEFAHTMIHRNPSRNKEVRHRKTQKQNKRAWTRCAVCDTTPRGSGEPGGSGRGACVRGAINNRAPHRSPRSGIAVLRERGTPIVVIRINWIVVLEVRSISNRACLRALPTPSSDINTPVTDMNTRCPSSDVYVYIYV